MLEGKRGCWTAAASAANFLPISSHFWIPKAAHPVVIHHTYGLHECVADRWTHKVEAAVLQVFAHGDGFLGFCRHVLALAPGVLDRPAADKLPDVAIETTELFLDF